MDGFLTLCQPFSGHFLLFRRYPSQIPGVVISRGLSPPVCISTWRSSITSQSLVIYRQHEWGKTLGLRSLGYVTSCDTLLKTATMMSLSCVQFNFSVFHERLWVFHYQKLEATYFQSSHWCLTACILSSVNSCWEVALNTLKYTANSIHKRQTFCYCQACKLRNDSMIMCLKHFFRLFSSYTGSILTNLSLKLFFNTVVYSWHDVWSDSSKKKPETVEKFLFSSWEFICGAVVCVTRW